MATTVALGGSVDDAVRALGADEAPATMRTPVEAENIGDLVAGLSAKTRPERAAALATAIRDVLIAADGIGLG